MVRVVGRSSLSLRRGPRHLREHRVAAYGARVDERRERWQFLFGEIGDPDEWAELDNELRSELLAAVLGPLGGKVAQARLAAAHHLVTGSPPETWETVTRLTAGGLTRNEVLDQIQMVMHRTLVETEDGGVLDMATFHERLARLPLPSPGLVEDTMMAIAEERQVLSSDDLLAETIRRLGGDDNDEVLRHLVELSEDELNEPFGPMLWLAGNRTAHLGALAAGIVLTHEVTESDRASGLLELSFDLGGFVDLVDPILAGARDDEDLTLFVRTDGRRWMAIEGPDGWLDDYPVGSTIAVTVDPDDEEVSIKALAAAPDVDGAVVDLLRSVYDHEVDEPDLPVDATTLIAGMLAENRTVFAQPQASLSRLCEAAGLERRGNEVADDPFVWQSAAHLARMGRVFHRADEDNEFAAIVLEVLAVFDDVSLGDPVDDADIVEVLDTLADDQDVLGLVAEELFRADNDPVPTPALFATLIRIGDRGSGLAAAHYLAALDAEFSLDLAVAEEHLELAVEANGTFAFAIDRLAWFASDRGDAPRALKLWRKLTGRSIHQSADEVEPFARPRSSNLGRNDPCWCGSGRKFKQCHLGQIEQAPLPDRVGWLCRKAVDFLERSGSEAWDEAFALAMILAGHDVDHLAGVFDNPVVIDLVLTEGGWFGRFLDARGAILPDDEALLAASWLTVDRSVYEVVHVDPGVGIDLRDLRSGELHQVREQSFSRQAEIGMQICARAVPDGETNQLIGAVLTMPIAQEARVLDLLDSGDPEAIAAWVHSLTLPPQVRNREGEELVQCEVEFEPTDRRALVRHLDKTYATDARGRAWSEHHDLDETEGVVRAAFHLENDRLTISTNSNERADRILHRLRAIDGRVVSDTRTPLDLSADRPGVGGRPLGLPDLRDMPGLSTDVGDDVLEEVMDQMERRWCDESVPALGGLTPRDAATDPTRREDVDRLIASFERRPSPKGAISMRPHRLRSILGL